MRLSCVGACVHWPGPAGTVVAPQPLTFDVEAGERLLVLGPAQSGKSTLLKLLAGLLRPSEGAVLRDGVPTAVGAPQFDASAGGRIGMVFQNDALFDSLSAEENVALGLRRLGAPRQETLRQARGYLERVGLGAAAARLPSALSGGMRKRLGLARALAGRPEVLLADDPFAGLDDETAADIVALLGEVCPTSTWVVALPAASAALPPMRVLCLRGPQPGESPIIKAP